MPLDDFLPRFDFREIHSTPRGRRARRGAGGRPRRDPARGPAAGGADGAASGPSRWRPALAQATDRRAVRARRLRCSSPANERELVYGGVGRFWTLGGGLARIGPRGVRGLRRARLRQGGLRLPGRARPGEAGLCSSRRRESPAPTAHARRSFGRYWRLIQPGQRADPARLAAGDREAAAAERGSARQLGRAPPAAGRPRPRSCSGGSPRAPRRRARPARARGSARARSSRRPRRRAPAARAPRPPRAAPGRRR